MVSFGDKITYFCDFIPVFHLQVETALGSFFPLGLFPPVREILEYKFTILYHSFSEIAYHFSDFSLTPDAYFFRPTPELNVSKPRLNKIKQKSLRFFYRTDFILRPVPKT